MAGLPQGPYSAIRLALASPWPSLRLEAAAIVQRALDTHKTQGRAAESLGLSRTALVKLMPQVREITGAGKTR